MRISRVFTDALLAPQKPIILDEKTSHYLCKVLRLQNGAELVLFDGRGRHCSAFIETINKKKTSVVTGKTISDSHESPLKIHLGMAISKGDRMDLVMQKATELGVTAITPLTSERTELKLKGERLEKKCQHWQKIIISACEQCGQNIVPELMPLQSVTDWTNSVNADKKLVLHHRTDQKLQAHEAIKSVALLIGPEGGLSDREIQQAEKRQFNALQLGPRVLRTETAPLAAISILQYIWGDF